MFTLRSDKSNRKINIGNFFVDIAEFYAGNVILFQIKVNTRNIKQTALARYFIKVTAAAIKSH